MEFVDFHSCNRNDYEGYMDVKVTFGGLSRDYRSLGVSPGYDEAYESSCLNQATETHHDQARQQVHNRKSLSGPESDVRQNKQESNKL